MERKTMALTSVNFLNYHGPLELLAMECGFTGNVAKQQHTQLISDVVCRTTTLFFHLC